MRVLSLGAGVQSSTLVMMACLGMEHFDAAVFADTQWESKRTYRHLSWLTEQADKAGLPIYRETRGSIREDALAGKSISWMPMHLRGNGPPAQARRQCTSNYKIALIKRRIRALGATRKQPAEVCKGISLDEIGRMKDSDVQYIRHAYPLIDRRMTRVDCRLWLLARGYPDPPKSACLGCPFHDTAGWRAVKADPEEWADVVAFDRAMRDYRKAGTQAFLHFSGKPLEDVDLSTEQDNGQLELFQSECDGVCDV